MFFIKQNRQNERMKKNIEAYYANFLQISIFFLSLHSQYYYYYYLCPYQKEREREYSVNGKSFPFSFFCYVSVRVFIHFYGCCSYRKKSREKERNKRKKRIKSLSLSLNTSHVGKLNMRICLWSYTIYTHTLWIRFYYSFFFFVFGLNFYSGFNSKSHFNTFKK